MVKNKNREAIKALLLNYSSYSEFNYSAPAMALIGHAFFMIKEIKVSSAYFQRAVELDINNKTYRTNLDKIKKMQSRQK